MIAERLLVALAKTPHAMVSPSAFSARDAVWVNGKELAHLHPSEAGYVEVDLRLGRKRIRALAADARFTIRSRSSEWVEMRVATPSDVTDAARLFAEVAEEHAPVEGTSAKPPPSGSDLARRRRFH